MYDRKVMDSFGFHQSATLAPNHGGALEIHLLSGHSEYFGDKSQASLRVRGMGLFVFREVAGRPGRNNTFRIL